MRVFDRRILIFAALISGAASAAGASSGACARKRMPPNQTRFWGCVSPNAACVEGICQAVHYSGFMPFSSCECLPAASDPDDLSYGTGGFWNAGLPSTDPAPGANVTFELTAGLNSLVIYPNADVDVATGTIQNAQQYSGSSDLSGGFTIAIEMASASVPADSLVAHVAGLSLTMTSWSFEGMPTGPTTITLAADGGDAAGFWHAASGTLQFDAPVHCTASNALMGSFDYYFRPILIEASEGKVGEHGATNQFALFATGRLQPKLTVPVQAREWGGLKQTYR